MVLLPFFIVILDQISKTLAVRKLKGQASKVIIKNFFELVYVENTGAAFGILKGKQWFFYLVTIVSLVVIVYVLYKYRSRIDIFVKLPLYMIMGGSIGNLIDRILYGYVVDFFSFQFASYNFAVFNVADIAITLGSIGMIIFILIGKIDLED